MSIVTMKNAEHTEYGVTVVTVPAGTRLAAQVAARRAARAAR